jgi:hypothetical protein
VFEAIAVKAEYSVKFDAPKVLKPELRTPVSNYKALKILYLSKIA